MLDPDIEAVYAACPAKLRRKLLALRQMILQVAAATPGVGGLKETLKWGQPSFLTTSSKSGTTIRIDRLPGKADRYGLFVPCQTDLIDQFKEIYPDQLNYQGKRAIVFHVDDPVPIDELQHCIALALTYKARKKAATSAR